MDVGRGMATLRNLFETILIKLEDIEQALEELKQANYKGLRSVICQNCGMEFGATNFTRKYCSNVCYRNWHSKMRVKKRKDRVLNGKV